MLLTRLALRARVVTLVILALLIAGGIWSYTRLEVELFPSVDFPLCHRRHVLSAGLTRRPS